MKYLIRHNTAVDDELGYPLYWSNDDGYGDLYDATWFDEESRRLVSLPLNGHWVEVKTPDDLVKCPECGKKQITHERNGSEHEEGCQLGCAEQQEYEDRLAEFRKSQGVNNEFDS